jgi:hypothetical protein
MKLLIRFAIALFVFFPLSSYAETGGFEIVSIQDSSGYSQLAKYHVNTGQTWYVSDGKFKSINDYSKIPTSTYKVILEKSEKGWNLMRLDTVSGRTWWGTSDVWVEILEK